MGKVLIIGAGGMIGSNMVQSALMLGLTPNICLPCSFLYHSSVVLPVTSTVSSV